MQLQQFLNHLLSTHYFVNGEEMEYFDLLKLESMERINYVQTERNYENKESLYFNNSYEIENQMCSYVECGNEVGLRRFLEQPFMTHEGITASDSLRQAKNIYIVTITLATRAAIRGGLDTEIAYQLSDLYIQQIEQLLSLESIQNFAKEAIFNFARRVQEAKYNIPEDGSMSKIIQYVFKSVNQPLTATHVAHQFGYSRTYLSAVFKKNVGTSLHQFIVECKLKEAQHLLVFTNKPISEISSYLCFSSQSHFQTVFKKMFLLSPLQYRKHNQGKSSG
ncbi:helix-turn-helix domain-containing protein [Paenibacillus taichungensis]